MQLNNIEKVSPLPLGGREVGGVAVMSVGWPFGLWVP